MPNEKHEKTVMVSRARGGPPSVGFISATDLSGWLDDAKREGELPESALALAFDRLGLKFAVVIDRDAGGIFCAAGCIFDLVVHRDGVQIVLESAATLPSSEDENARTFDLMRFSLSTTLLRRAWDVATGALPLERRFIDTGEYEVIREGMIFVAATTLQALIEAFPTVLRSREELRRLARDGSYDKWFRAAELAVELLENDLIRPTYLANKAIDELSLIAGSLNNRPPLETLRFRIDERSQSTSQTRDTVDVLPEEVRELNKLFGAREEDGSIVSSFAVEIRLALADAMNTPLERQLANRFRYPRGLSL